MTERVMACPDCRGTGIEHWYPSINRELEPVTSWRAPNGREVGPTPCWSCDGTGQITERPSRWLADQEDRARHS